MPTQEQRRQRLRRAGEILYGTPRCGALLAKGLGYNGQSIAQVLSGDRPVTDQIEAKLIDLCRRESVALATRSQQASSMAFALLTGEFRLEDCQGDDGWSPAPPKAPLTDEDHARLEEELNRPDDDLET